MGTAIGAGQLNTALTSRSHPVNVDLIQFNWRSRNDPTDLGIGSIP